jgi:FKBP-type peptidyl-prolyl cis-trans isomerase FkpA
MIPKNQVILSSYSVSINNKDMRNIFSVIVLLSGLVFTGCDKKDEDCNISVVKAPETEIAILEQYLRNNGIEAQRDSSGFFYTINAEGIGEKPSACADVTVNYKGWLTNGTVFDEAREITFNLGGLIKGWQTAIPLLGKGGKITLYLPPSLGYGPTSSGNIPGNSILIFSIDLIRFN